MARLIHSGQGQQLDLPGRKSLEIVGSQSGAVSSTFRIVEIAPGQPERGPHLHDGFEEVIHVLEGRGVLITDSGEIELREGDTCLVPSKELHATRNSGAAVLRLLCYFPINDVSPATQEFADWRAR